MEREQLHSADAFLNVFLSFIGFLKCVDPYNGNCLPASLTNKRARNITFLGILLQESEMKQLLLKTVPKNLELCKLLDLSIKGNQFLKGMNWLVLLWRPWLLNRQHQAHLVYASWNGSSPVGLLSIRNMVWGIFVEKHEVESLFWGKSIMFCPRSVCRYENS